MKWMPSGLGAEPKKLIALVVLVVAAPALYYYNSQPDIPPGAVAPRPASGPAVTLPVTKARPAAKRAAVRVNEDFRPSLKLPEDYDVSSIDPTLKLDLLARVRSVGEVGGRRSLFEFYTPPPPPPPVKPIKPEPERPPPPTPPPPAPINVKPQPPPVPFKFFGYSGTPRDGNLRALLLDGEETIVARVGDVIRNRWKIARIGVSTIEVEDTTTKSTQPLQILPKCDDKDDTQCKR